MHIQLDPVKVTRFWRRLTGIPKGQFHKTYIFPKRKTKRLRRMMYGVCTVMVFDAPLCRDLRTRLLHVKSLVSASDPRPIRKRLVKELDK